jgi:hypothetical protein
LAAGGRRGCTLASVGERLSQACYEPREAGFRARRAARLPARSMIWCVRPTIRHSARHLVPAWIICTDYSAHVRQGERSALLSWSSWRPSGLVGSRLEALAGCPSSLVHGDVACLGCLLGPGPWRPSSQVPEVGVRRDARTKWDRCVVLCCGHRVAVHLCTPPRPTHTACWYWNPTACDISKKYQACAFTGPG